jgi:hypothetical protein
MIKSFSKILFVLIFCLSSQAAFSEIYLGLKPFSTLKDVKAKFPNATLTKMNPAWAQEKDLLYSIAGEGISGKLFIKFNDYRPDWKKRNSEYREESPTEYYAHFGGLDNTVIISWVRWIPEIPFPVERLVAKYGKPDKSGFDDDDFTLYSQWTSKGIYARLSDDGKVRAIDFNFTEQEVQAAIIREGESSSDAPVKKGTEK